MYKACVFDLDGTLVDTVESIAYIANKVLEYYHLPTLPIKDYNYYAGDGADVLMERCILAAGGDLSVLTDACVLYRELFAENPLYRITAYDGMKETLLELKKRGVKLGVCTNKPHSAAEKVIYAIYGKDLFDVIQGQVSEIPKKPAPDGPWMIAEAFGVKPAECMYVGDTNTDMKTGNAAGMFTIGVLWGFRDRKELEEHHAHQIISHPAELLDLQRGK